MEVRYVKFNVNHKYTTRSCKDNIDNKYRNFRNAVAAITRNNKNIKEMSRDKIYIREVADLEITW